MASFDNKKNRKTREILIFKQYTIKQFISLTLGLMFFLTGVALLIMYFIHTYAPIRSDVYKGLNNALSSFNSGTHTTIGFIGWGLICLLFGALVITLALSFASKLEEREKEKQARREMRLKALKEQENEALEDKIIASINNK